MAHGILNKYIWILNTIQRYGKISRKELCRLWKNADVSGGEPLARRSFYNYRMGIEELFGIRIEYNSSTYEYFIESGEETSSLSNWLINSMSINGMLNGADDLSDRIMLENIPSAHHLPSVLEAMKTSRKIRFSYTPFYRINATDGIVVEPYFLRVFKQRWYVIGYNTTDKKIKTYSLDRINSVEITEMEFTMPEIHVNDFFRNCFGIMINESSAKDVVLRVNSEQAKYLRALPLHHSQREEIYDGYSQFYYHLHITYDFVQEILSHGAGITVIAPAELRAMVVDSLKKSLHNYSTD